MTPLHPAVLPGHERLVVVVGPSGAGKDSLLQAWLAQVAANPPILHAARRSITRPSSEAAGSEPHEPLSEAAFIAALLAGDMAVHWQAHGLHYGVRRAQFEVLTQPGQWLLLNGSRQALPALRHVAPGMKVLAITASPHVLAARLAGRGREDAPAVAARLARSQLPWPDGIQPDHTVVNDGTLKAALASVLNWWWPLQAAATPAAPVTSAQLT